MDHGAHEDVNPDSTRELCDEVPLSQAMIPPPDSTEAGTEPCQAEIPGGGDRGKVDNTVSKEASSAGTEGTRDKVMGRKGCKHDKKGS